jgi:hypothetical protein
MWIFLTVLVAIGVAIFLPMRGLRALAARAMGVPDELIPEALGETNSCVVSFDDEKISHLRKSDGNLVSVRWDALSEIYVRLTDTGPNEDDAFLMLVDENDAGCSILMTTEGVNALLDRASYLHWFSSRALDAALEAIQARQLGVRKFLLWSAVRDGVAIPMGFLQPSSSGRIECDDAKLKFTSTTQDELVIPWSEFSKLQIVLDATTYYFRFAGAGHEFSASVLTEGLGAFLEKVKDIARFQSVEGEQALATEAIRACSLKRPVFTLIEAVSAA